jgi:hypothetical protein
MKCGAKLLCGFDSFSSRGNIDIASRRTPLNKRKTFDQV